MFIAQLPQDDCGSPLLPLAYLQWVIHYSFFTIHFTIVEPSPLGRYNSHLQEVSSGWYC